MTAKDSGFAYGLQISPNLSRLSKCVGGIPITYQISPEKASETVVFERMITDVESVRQVYIAETNLGTKFIYGGGQKFLWNSESRTVLDQSPTDVDLELRLATLYGPVLSWAAHSLGYLVLHGSAIKIGQRNVLFLAPRRGGKSTTIAYLNERGHQPISDDVCALKKVDGKWLVASGTTQFRLWEDSSDLFKDTYPLFEGTRKKGKEWKGTSEPWHEVDTIYVLQPDPVDEAKAEPISGAKKIATLLSQSRVVSWLNPKEKMDHLAAMNELANDIGIESLYNRVGLQSLHLLESFLANT